MPNALVMKSNSLFEGSSGKTGAVYADVIVDGEEYRVISPHGNYPKIVGEMRKEIELKFPDAERVVLVENGTLDFNVRRETATRYHFEDDLEKAPKDECAGKTVVIDGKRYKLEPAD